MENNKEKMLNEELYLANDYELQSIAKRVRSLQNKFNKTHYNNFNKRSKLAKKIFGSIGINPKVNNPIYLDYGVNTYIGDNFYSNYNLTILDVAKVIIGNDVLFGPNVSLFTASHPIDPTVRKEGYEYGKKIIIGNNVWLGGNVVVNPGVTIGDNTIIGSGSVVVKDIPKNVIAFGNPCEVYREFSKEDQNLWEKEKEKYLQTIKK